MKFSLFKIIFLFFLLQGNWIQAENADLSGAHMGYHPEDKDEEYPKHLLIKPIEGRIGSYLGLLVEARKERRGIFGSVVKWRSARPYRIDPRNLALTEYDMTPFDLHPTEGLKIINPDPSLLLSFSSKKEDEVKIKITNTGGTNKLGFQKSILFKDEESYLEWTGLSPGTYGIAAHEGAESFLISSWNTEAMAGAMDVFRGTSVLKDGKKILLEYFPLAYVAKKYVALAQGTQLADAFEGAVFFIKYDGITYAIFMEASSKEEQTRQQLVVGKKL